MKAIQSSFDFRYAGVDDLPRCSDFGGRAHRLGVVAPKTKVICRSYELL